MKMVKSLLLGSAAGFVAVAGAQAADLPVKAKAVEYVKVCSLYGAGYYYIPGTDTCIKVGGFVRFDTAWSGDVSGASSFLNNGEARFNRAETNYYNWRARYMISTDVRTQTEYGTLRAYIKAGWQYTSGLTPAQGDTGTGDRTKDGGVYTERAFIQFAGFTFGKSQSFFDLWSAASVANANLWGYDDTGNGINLAAYTAMLGNGFSFSLAVEDPQAYRRMNMTGGAAANAFTWGSVGNNEYGGTSMPDIVGVFRVDQAWGSILAGALVHQLNPVYYHTGACAGVATVGCIDSGGPDVKYGWAATVGGDFNLPWAKGDRFLFQATYTQGVMGTVMGGQNNTSIAWWNGNGNGNVNEVTLGWIVDAVRLGAPAQFDLTTGWAVIAGLEHYWTPSLRSSVFGDYVAIRYNTSAQTTVCANLAAAATPSVTCNPNLNLWNVGTRTVWTPVPNLDISVEGVYSFVDQNMVGTTTLAAGVMTPSARSMVDQGIWSANFRVQRNFWP